MEYKFTHKTETVFIEYSFDAITLTEILEHTKYFLQACSFVIEDDIIIQERD